ncbi:uncharacterized protein LOC124118971 isoform X5 [Haliotis rufescens]|uniref:uncharacterized protein LOC124118971 isoform X5 n=1 Tax=Haliotis rufescens TaxID=6454 RepID=UPI001EB012A4|nr:uncharacterized protein LOC124118971 isoform X5 [Haliotis rufescens]
MANSYHMEALRKQRLLDRKNEALRRLEKQGTDLTKDAVMDGYLSKQTPKESPLITDEGQFNQQRQNHESLLAKNLRKGFDFSQNRKHRLENESIPNLPPPTILAIQRDHVYKIFHPYDFHS